MTARRVTCIGAAIALVILCLGLATPFTRAQQSSKPLSKSEIIYLLRGQVSPVRITTLARERGIDFQVTPDVETDLRKLGADNDLLATLRTLSLFVTLRAILLVDNGNSFAVTVEETGGGKLCDVPRRATCRVEVTHGAHDLRALDEGGKVISEVKMNIKAPAKYVFNPGGQNSYYVKTQGYGNNSAFSSPPPDEEKGNPEWLEVTNIDLLFEPFPGSVRGRFSLTGLFRKEPSAPPRQTANAGQPPTPLLEARWNGTVARIDWWKTTLLVRRGNVERLIHFNAETKWTEGGVATDMGLVKEGDEVFCIGRYEGDFIATRVDRRPSR